MNMEGQTLFVHKITAILSVVENGAREILPIVEVRGGEVHNRGDKFGFYVLLNVTYTGGPRQSWRKGGTGSYNRAVQPHWSPLFYL